MANPRVAGYKFLIEKYHLKNIPHWCTSFIGNTRSIQHTITKNGFLENYYPSQNWPGDSEFDHLEFAIKNEGVSLTILYEVFPFFDAQKLSTFISARPLSRHRRKLWFFYEFLLDSKLPMDDLPNKGNYIDLLDSEKYYTLKKATRSTRHRVKNNLLGTRDFCPIIKKTKLLKKIETTDFTNQCSKILNTYPSDLLRRAMSYLYKKETKSSFEIEHIKPSPSRTDNFISLLALAESQDFCEKRLLIELQNMIVDSRFADSDYRDFQNYVGQTITLQKEIVHFICPKPSDVQSLMRGLIETHHLLKQDTIPAIVHAAVIAYGFVFIHPFQDGNGRIHRFLIHNILALLDFTPKGLMIPISAAILKNQSAYDHSLETFSNPLLQHIEYNLTDKGEMEILNETAHWYRYMDLTVQAEILSDFISDTISREIVEELDFLEMYDKTKNIINNIIDMPDRLIDLFIHLSLQNKGKLSARKRASHFDFLTDEELDAMEQAVKDENRQTGFR